MSITVCFSHAGVVRWKYCYYNQKAMYFNIYKSTVYGPNIITQIKQGKEILKEIRQHILAVKESINIATKALNQNQLETTNVR